MNSCIIKYRILAEMQKYFNALVGQVLILFTYLFFEGLYFTKKNYMKNFNIKNKENKIKSLKEEEIPSRTK